MIGKKINQLATELAPTTTDLTIIGDPVTGVSKKITLEQLGAIFGGAVSFYTTLGDFPATGVIDIIYCAKDTKKLYLWSGSAYVEVFPSQSLLDTYQLRSEKGVSNGYASLDVNGKVPIGQLPNSIMEYKGTWNAATNTPTLANGTGDTGDVYICNAAGTVNFGAGPITFAVGDYVVYSGTIWQRSSGAVGTVTSVGLSITGDSIGVTGSPITTSGTLALAFAGTGAQYIKGDGTLATFPSIISQAQNLVTEVYNNTGATLTKGTIVYINGGQGNLPTVTKALAIGDSTSAQTYGVVQTDITNMNNGYVVVAGRLTDLDTQAYSNGTQLYLSSTTAGTWTSTKQYAPNHLVYVGIVVRSHPTQGVVEIKIQNGYEMDELHNVAAQSPDNNDILQYKTATSLWTKVAGTTTNIAEGTNLYYTDARSRAALSFTAGSGAYNSTTGVITIPTNTNQLTNGAAFITLASLSAGAGISYNNTTGVIASTITQYTDALARAAISLTTTGTSGAATYNTTTGVLNIPQYQTALTNPVTGTGTTNYLPKFTGSTTVGNSTLQEVSGNLGLGVTPSTWSIGTAFDIANGPAILGINNATHLTNNSVFNSGWKYKASSFAQNLILENDGAFKFNIAPSGTAGNAISFTQAMTLNALGNLAIGTTSILGSSVERSIHLSAPTNQYATLYLTNSANTLKGIFAIADPTSSIFVGSQSNHAFSIITNDTPRLTIASTGAATFFSSVTANSTINGYYGSISTGQSPATSGTTPNNPMLNLTNNRGVGLYVGGQHASPFGIWLQVSDTSNLGTNYPLLLQPNGGNVGIGTTSPANRLTVAGSSGTIMSLSNGADADLLMNFTSGVTLLTPTTGILAFGTSSTERMRITSGGNVGIGINNPTAILQVRGPNAVGVFFDAQNNGAAGATFERINANSSPYNRYTFANGNVEIPSGSIQTGAPTNGTAQPWRLGDARSGSISTNSYIIVSVNGTTYSIPALNGLP